jgi:hypothetical protein
MDSFQKQLITDAEAKDGRPYNQENIDLVMSYLHYSGSRRKLINDEQFIKAFLLCNGFGDGISVAFANEIEFDWSHVRDSSPIGFDNAAAYLKGLGL